MKYTIIERRHARPEHLSGKLTTSSILTNNYKIAITTSADHINISRRTTKGTNIKYEDISQQPTCTELLFFVNLCKITTKTSNK